MVLPAVPPPLTKKLCWWGDHPIALTAVKWQLLHMIGFAECKFQIIKLFSFPPHDNWLPSNDSFNPQTSWLWPKNLIIIFSLLFLHLISLVIILQSFEPLDIILPFHETTQTLSLCPQYLATNFFLLISYISTHPKVDPSLVYLLH